MVDKIKETENTLCKNFTCTFALLGRKWNGLIIEALLVSGAKRFLEISRAVSGCSDRVLVERLKELEAANIVIRETYDDSNLIEYKLTEAGKAMRPMMKAIHEWSDKYNNVAGLTEPDSVKKI
ncbi:MarR family transcriptional regulator [Leuconostoc litchii]|uniref:Transcriptional regulator n=1 Tax=Leuconostoc litchii TaxID=1981069 RepID=A0A6P2CN43_9LACO|nr:helix-turn-helix domain-containing protein [Leuconostoc litchii]TYC47468.1 transcriptional regulator [Leuconostoc litchii]GMA69488.1 MarR family transcriptional regulator [Leuconostoc litchii]